MVVAPDETEPAADEEDDDGGTFLRRAYAWLPVKF